MNLYRSKVEQSRLKTRYPQPPKETYESHRSHISKGLTDDGLLLSRREVWDALDKQLKLTLA